MDVVGILARARAAGATVEALAGGQVRLRGPKGAPAVLRLLRALRTDKPAVRRALATEAVLAGLGPVALVTGRELEALGLGGEPEAAAPACVGNGTPAGGAAQPPRSLFGGHAPAAAAAGPVASPVKWHGGKGPLAKKIIRHMPRHMVYGEPYAGGLSVLLARDPTDERLWAGTASDTRGVAEYVNDLDGRLTNFWRVLQDEGLFARFLRTVRAVPFSEAEWREAHAHEYGRDPVADAKAFFVLNRQSLAGRMAGFAPLSTNRTRRGMSEQASAWLTAVEGLPAVHERLKRVMVLNRPALDVIRQLDGPQTLFYLDPPYVHGTRAATEAYAHEMADGDHRELLALLQAVRGKVMLSGYPSPMYDEALRPPKWTLHTCDVAKHSAGGESKARATECLWCNF